jgi:hypothetical protein
MDMNKVARHISYFIDKFNAPDATRWLRLVPDCRLAAPSVAQASKKAVPAPAVVWAKGSGAHSDSGLIASRGSILKRVAT